MKHTVMNLYVLIQMHHRSKFKIIHPLFQEFAEKYVQYLNTILLAHTIMSFQYVVNYDGRRVPCNSWISALTKAKEILNAESDTSERVSVISLLRNKSQEECETTGYVSIYRINKTNDIILYITYEPVSP
jgi:hypothetical protein